MITHGIELPPLPEASKMYDIPGYDEEELKDYARAAIEPYAKRIAQLEADRKCRKPTAAEISDVIREITGCQDIKNGEDSLVVALGMLFHRGATPQPAEPDKQHPDDVAVDAFAAAMKAKLKRAREEKGRGGWQDMSATDLSAMLREHVEKGDPVDVANLAMMLHQNGQGITPAEPVTIPETVASDNPEPVAWIQRSYLNLIRESNVALHNVVVRGSILDGDGDVVPLYTAPQHAEPIVSDVEAIVRLLERREWADHVATTPLGQRLETAVTVLVGADPQPSEPVEVPSDDLAHEIWAAAQTAPGEGIEDAVERVAALLARYGKGTP